LIKKNTGIDVAMEFSRSAPTDARSLKTQQRATPRSTFVPGEPTVRTAMAIDGAGACRSARAPASLERR